MNSLAGLMMAKVGEVAISSNLSQFLLVLCVSLTVATLPKLFTWLRQIPYTLMLVIVGAGLALLDVRLVNLSPELILLIFLPPLLFEAAWNLHWGKFKQESLPIVLYAVFGVVITVALIATGLTQTVGIAWSTALLIGACLAATDPVSVVALFRELGVGKQPMTVMEGESLFNDGMAVVAFSVLLGFALGESDLAVQPIALQFIRVVGVGVGIGALIGFAISYLTQRFDLPLVEQSLTLVSAYGAYLLAEELGGSGVLATVVAGIILGNFGSQIGMSPRTRLIVTEFWEFVSFFVNSIVFLLIGDQLRAATLQANLGAIAVTVAAMIVSRALFIYGFGWLSNRLAKSQLTIPEQTILWWGGLRGSVSIALSLSVPVLLSGREQVIAIVFGAVMFTLLVQGLTIKPMLQRLNLLPDEPAREAYIEAIARQAALKRVLHHLEQGEKSPSIEPEFYAYQSSLIRGELASITDKISKLDNQYPNVRDFAKTQLRNELLAIEASTYADFLRAGRLNRQLSPLLEDIAEA